MGEFVHAGGELDRGQEAVQNANAPATGRAQRIVAVVDRFERDAAFADRGLQRDASENPDRLTPPSAPAAARRSFCRTSYLGIPQLGQPATPSHRH